MPSVISPPGTGRLAPSPVATAKEHVWAALQQPVLEVPGGAENALPAPAEQCPNCGAERAGTYCHDCGQEFLSGRLTLRRFWHEFAERYLKLERGLWLTFRELCTDPGMVPRGYVEGQRRRYTNPLGYFLVAATLSVLAFTAVEPIMQTRMLDQISQMYGPEFMEDMEEIYAKVFPDAEEPLRAFVDFYVGFQKKTYTYLTLLLCGVYAVLLRLFFPGPRQGGRNQAETLIFSVYVVGHATVVLLPVTVGATVFSLPIHSFLLMLATVGLYVVFAAWAARGFYGRSAASAALAGLAMAGALLTYLAAMTVLAITVLFWDVLVKLAAIGFSKTAAFIL